jgi:hypothetical protein
MIGYKAFRKGLLGFPHKSWEKSRYTGPLNNFKYEIGKIYEINEKLQLNKIGLHVNNWYKNFDDTEYAIIKILGNYIDDTLTNQSVTDKMEIIKKITRIQLIDCVENGDYVCLNGNIESYSKGRLHSYNDLPAIKWANGSRSWYRYGILHRDNNLPARININGDKRWYTRGVLYRVEYANGIHIWHENGKRFDNKSFIKRHRADILKVFSDNN